MAHLPAPQLRAFAIYSLIALALIIAVCAKRVDIASQGKPALDFSNIVVSDFMNDWTAAHLVQMGDVATIFNPKAYSAFMDALWGAPVEWHVWSYPPHLLLLIPPLAHFSYPVAWLLWSMLGLLGYYAVLRLAAPTVPKAWQILLTFSPAAMVCLLHGQTGLFCASFLLGGLFLLPKRPYLAGILFGLLTLKPHLGVLLVPLLLMRGEWKAIATASLTAATLILMSILSFGVEPWLAYFTTTREIHVGFLEDFHGFYLNMMPGIIPALRALGVSMEAAWPIYAVLAIPSAIAALWLVKREGLSPRAVFAFALVTLIATPYGFNYDMTSISLAMGIYLLHQSTQTARALTLYRLLWLAPALVYLVNFIQLPIVPILLLGAVFLLVREHKVAAT